MMRWHVQWSAAVVAVALASMMSGCSKQPAAASDAIPRARHAETSKPDYGSLPRPTAGMPDSEYVALSSGSQLLFLYNAFSGLPPDFEKMAGEYSSEFASTSDSFRKHDLLEALKPKFSAQIDAARAHPYVRWDQPATRVEHYDFTRKGFALKDAVLDEGGYGYMADIRGYNIAFTNGGDLDFIAVADEARARELEAAFQRVTPAIKIFAFVQTADDRGGRTVRARIVKVQILDRNGAVLLERMAD